MPAKTKSNWLVRSLRWMFPWKGDRPKTIISKLIFLIALCVFIVCAVLLIQYFWNDAQADTEYNNIKSLYTEAQPQQPEDQPQIEMPEGYREQFRALYGINPDIKGWITIPNTTVDYPVVQTTDNDYYLNHTFERNYNTVGVPFIDYRCSFGPSLSDFSDNTIIYGHNIKSNKMFHEVLKYADLDFYKQNPTFQLNTVYQDYTCKVIAAYITNGDMSLPDSFAYHNFINASSEEEYFQYLNESVQRSFYYTGVDVEYGDKLVTLSTCTYEYDNARFVLLARLVREGEDTQVDVSQARNNPAPFYTQGYCQKFGLTQNPHDDSFVYYQ